MDMKTDTPADDADAVIAEVFRLTGTCLTRDDPVMAVLLMQRQMFQTAFAGFTEQQAEQRLEFLKQLAAHERKITAAAAQLERYREQILADFVRQADRHIEEIEPKIYASTSRRVAQDIDEANARLEGRLKILLAATLAAVSVLAVSVVWLVFTVSKTG